MEKVVFYTLNFDGVQAEKLLETDFSKEIRISMQKGSVMKEHKAPAPIIVQILKGCVAFEVGSEILILNEFDTITLKANAPHSLMANEDSIIRLSLSKMDSEKRVFNIVN